MLLLVKPYLGCNINCSYCYQRDFRRSKKPPLWYDLNAIINRMEEFSQENLSDKNFCIGLHGGEILVLPKNDVEALLSKSFELLGKSDIQTNGTLIDDDYIAMFKKYKTNVGISWDGPDELSEYRPGTKTVGAMIDKLVKEGIRVSIIIVISKANAGTKQKLEKLKKYLLHLKRIRVFGRFSFCLGTSRRELPMEKLIDTSLDLADFCFKENIQWPPFKEVTQSLMGKNSSCFFSGCDVFSTSSVNIVLGDGSLTGCMFINRPAVLLRDQSTHDTRSEILPKVPQEFGGCKGCLYWPVCRGGCPSATIGNDWRNRSYLCPLWKALFTYHENLFRCMGVATVLACNE